MALVNQEIWRFVVGFDGKYQVSNFGRVAKTPKAENEPIRCFRGWRTKDGYKVVSLYKNGKVKSIKVHRLVMTAFKGFSKLEIHHKDGDKDNNRLDNLEYVTHEQNMQFERKHQQKKKVSFNDIMQGA